MEENAALNAQDYVDLDLFSPEYTALAQMDIEAIHEFLSASTTEEIVEFIKLTVENKTKKTLERTLALRTLSFGGALFSGLFGVPLATKNGSPEEVVGILISLILTGYFVKKIQDAYNGYAVAVAAENHPTNHPLLHLLPDFYDQLAANAQDRMLALEVILSAQRVHNYADTSMLAAATRSALTMKMHQLAKVQNELISFPAVVDKHILNATKSLKDITFEDAIPSIVNRLLRATWQEWEQIDKKIVELEQSLPARKTRPLKL